MNHVLSPPIEFGMAFLAAESLHLSYRDTCDADVGQGFTDVIKLERLDDCRNHFHMMTP